MKPSVLAVATVVAMVGCVASGAAGAASPISLPHIGLFDSSGEKKPLIAAQLQLRLSVGKLNSRSTRVGNRG